MPDTSSLSAQLQVAKHIPVVPFIVRYRSGCQELLHTDCLARCEGASKFAVAAFTSAMMKELVNTQVNTHSDLTSSCEC